MKKISISGLFLAAALVASAQADLLKQAEKSFKGIKEYPEYEAKVKEIEPLFTNPETMKQAQTYYIPGKAAFDVYDNLYLKMQLGQKPDPKQMGQSILDGYNYFMKALPLDPVTDAKGKTKTKYTKNIINIISGHHNDFSNAGAFLWDAKDYKGCYDAFEIYCTLPSNPLLGKDAPKAPADSVIGMTRYNQALAAWQANDLDKAIDAFSKAINLGHVNNDLLNYACSVAAQAKNNDKLVEFAQKGIELYGDTNPNYMLYLLNSYVENKDFATAHKVLNDAIAKNPNVAEYYFSLGVIDESEGNYESAEKNYKKAIDMKPEYAAAYQNYGRMLVERHDKINAIGDNMSQADYNKLRAETLRPILLEAAGVFEKAYELDPENLRDALNYLRNIYYALEDAANLERIENLLKN